MGRRATCKPVKPVLGWVEGLEGQDKFLPLRLFTHQHGKTKKMKNY